MRKASIYGIHAQVKLSDGGVQQCLVPVACLMNHSPWPHVIQYGHVDPSSRRLNFPLFRYSSSQRLKRLTSPFESHAKPFCAICLTTGS